MVEGTGLENRQTGNGFEGSNHSLSVDSPEGRSQSRGRPSGFPLGVLSFGMVLPLLLATQGSLPEACILTGLCNIVQPAPPVAPGVLFVAVGMVWAGVWGMRRRPVR